MAMGKSYGKLENFTISKGIENLLAVLDWVKKEKKLNSEKMQIVFF